MSITSPISILGETIKTFQTSQFRRISGWEGGAGKVSNPIRGVHSFTTQLEESGDPGPSCPEFKYLYTVKFAKFASKVTLERAPPSGLILICRKLGLILFGEENCYCHPLAFRLTSTPTMRLVGNCIVARQIRVDNLYAVQP